MAFQDTLPLPLEVILPIIAAIASFSVAADIYWMGCETETRDKRNA